MSATRKLREIGQSVWLDNITRDLLDDGSISRCIGDLGVSGLTSNPSIFDKAVSGSSAYDEQVRRLAGEGRTVEEIFFELALDDLIRAADLFAGIHDQTDGEDGWVSLEVSPLLADDTEATVASAIELHARANRSNLYIKIPGTPAGLPAIEEAVAAGVPVNVTLLFSTEQYLAAAEAYLAGLERRRDAGQHLKVSSVASLFISRWDVAIASQVPGELHNTLGLAIGQESYAAYRELIASERVERLVAQGAPIQRLLFASTGVKDPSAPDTLYVTGLAAPDTVNTMPDATLAAFADHGEIDGVLEADALAAAASLARITDAGVDLPALAARLQEEGKVAFVKSWQDLLASITGKATP